MKTGRRERGQAVSLLLCFLLSLGVFLGPANSALAQERTGSITGVLTDAQGGVLPGVNVVLTNRQTGRVTTVQTDGSGRYLANLDPGVYSIRFELSGFAPSERQDVEVLLGRSFEINTQLRVGSLTEAVQVTAESSPLIDARSTMISHNVTAEEFDRLPKGRSYQSIALTAPSVNSGELEGGFQVNGASGAENAFTVDGVVTNSLVNGQSRQNTVFEYLQEVQVKTTGIQAEFGGALGGVVSAVTKSGGNRLQGEAHYYYEGSSLSGGPVKRLVLDPVTDRTAFYTQDEEQPDHRNEFGGSVGGPIVRDRLFFFGSFSPRMLSTKRNYLFEDGKDPGDAERDITQQQAFGKLSYSARRFNLHGSALWTPTTAEGTLLAYNGSVPNGLVSTKTSFAPNLTRGYEINQVNTSVLADIVLTNTAFLSLRGGVFHDRYSDTGVSTTTSYTYQTPSSQATGVPLSLQGPINTFNTPRAQISEWDTTKRRFFNVDYNHTFTGGGFHTLKGGVGFQRTTNDINTAYPGGYVLIYWGSDFTFGGVNRGGGQYGYYEVNDRRITGQVGGDITSLYIQDQWTVGERLTLNLGVRTENEKIPSFRPEVKKYAIEFGFADKLAPRLGATFDLRGDGTTKLFGSWGRYFDWTKYELARGSFGAERWCIHYRALDTLALDTLSLSNMPGRDLWTVPGQCRDRRVPSFVDEIDPELEPMMQDSISGGLEHQLGGGSVLTVHYVRNQLRQTIEDVGFLTAAGDEGYLISNPGERQAAIQFPTGRTPLGQAVPLPKRQYDALELGVTRRWGNNWFASANYTLSRLYGNYAGLAASDEYNTPTTGVTSATAQQQAGSLARPGGNVNRYWDLDELLYDSRGNLDVTGRLGTDRPHVLKVYGAYQFDFGTQIGAFIYTGSGTPISTYVTSNHGADIFVEGRGDMGRTPVLNYTNLLVSHELRMGGGDQRLRLELNVLNLFNQKTSRHIFNYLNRGSGIERGPSLIDLSRVDLTQGYDYNALIRATTDGANAYDPRFRMDDLFEDGTRGQFMVKWLF